MRITVTVVVIMFELTGALTYILPTMVSMSRIGLVQGVNMGPDRLTCHEGSGRFLRYYRHR